MVSSPSSLKELTALVMSCPALQKTADGGFYSPDDIAGYIAWELFYALHPQGAYLAPAAGGKIRTNFAYHWLMKDIGLIDEDRNITPRGMQQYRSLVPFYFKSEE